MTCHLAGRLVVSTGGEPVLTSAAASEYQLQVTACYYRQSSELFDREATVLSLHNSPPIDPEISGIDSNGNQNRGRFPFSAAVHRLGLSLELILEGGPDFGFV